MTVDEQIKRVAQVARFPRNLDQRTISRLSVLAAVVVVALVAGVYGLIKNQSPALAGTDLGGTPAPGFSLTDQNGATISLAGLRGHPVVLAFMYTHCPDVCPLTAEKMRLAAQHLGAQAGQVAWVGISVDPAGDSADSAKQFAATHGLTGKLHFLMGTREQLVPIWKAYFLPTDGSPTRQPQVGAHTGAVYLIDTQGRERIYLDSSFDPVNQLAPDLRSLLGG